MSLFLIPGEDFDNARVLKGGTGCPDSGIYIGVVTRIAPNTRTNTPGNFDAFIKIPGYDYDKLSNLISVAHDADGNPITAVAAKAGGRTNGAYTFAVHCGLTEEELKENGLADEDLIDREVGVRIETAYSEDGEVALYAEKVKTMTVEDAEKQIAEGVAVPRHIAPKREQSSGGGSDDGGGRTSRTRRGSDDTGNGTAPEPEKKGEEPPVRTRTRTRSADPEPEPEPEPQGRVRRRRPAPQ